MMLAEVPSSAKAKDLAKDPIKHQIISSRHLSSASLGTSVCVRARTPVPLSLPCSLCLFHCPGFFLIPFLPLTHQSLSGSFFCPNPPLLKDRTDKRTVLDQEWCHRSESLRVTITSGIYLRALNTPTVLSLTV